MIAIQQLPYWNDLPAREQQAIFKQNQELDRAANKLEQGRHLFELRGQLKPKGLYIHYLNMLAPQISKRSSFRLVEGWETASKFLPLPFIQAVVEMNVDLGRITVNRKVGNFTEIVTDLGGIPKTDNKEKQMEFVRRMLEARKKKKAAIRWPRSRPTPHVVTENVFTSARKQFRKIPEASRKAEITRLVAWLSSEFNVQLGSIKPEPPPRPVPSS